MTDISVRYIVDDVDAAVDFYTSLLQFEVRDAARAGLRDASPRASYGCC